MICTPFYWDFNDGTRAFAKRYQAALGGKMPNDMQAGMYAATAHLMKAMAQVKSADDGIKLVDAMKAMPTDDPLFGKGSIRVDGRRAASGLSDGDQVAGGIEGRMGLLQDRRDDQPRRRLAPARQRRLPVREGVARPGFPLPALAGRG